MITALLSLRSLLSSSQDSTFLSFLSLLFTTSVCYSLLYNDVLMENGEINFQVDNIFNYRSLEPSAAVIRCCCGKIYDIPSCS